MHCSYDCRRDGEGFDYMKDAVKLELVKSYSCGKDFVMEYKVLK